MTLRSSLLHHCGGKTSVTPLLMVPCHHTRIFIDFPSLPETESQLLLVAKALRPRYRTDYSIDILLMLSRISSHSLLHRFFFHKSAKISFSEGCSAISLGQALSFWFRIEEIRGREEVGILRSGML